MTQTRAILRAAAVCCSLGFTVGALGSDVWLELAGQWGGACYRGAMAGGYEYLCVGPRVVIIDVSQPDDPRFVGQTEPFPDVVYYVAPVGQHVYATVGSRLYIIDVADPAHPVSAATNYAVGELAASGGYLYALVGGPSVGVFDLTDPIAPVLLGTCPVSTWPAALSVDGQYAYYVTLFRLEIIDVSDPTAPFMVSSTAQAYPAQAVARNGYVYLTTEWYDGYCYLRILDATDPYAPVGIGMCQLPWTPDAVVISGDWAYVTVDRSSAHSGLYVIDISNPTDPAIVGESLLDRTSFLFSISVADSFAYLVDLDRGLRIYTAQDPTAPLQVAAYTLSGSGYAVTATSSYAYLDGRSGGLQVIDVANPAELNRTAFRPEGGLVRVVGNVGYSACNYGGLEILDLSDPADPVLLGTFQNVQCTRDVAVQRSYAYLSDWTGLIVVDVSDPGAPVEAGRCALGVASGVDVSGNYAYLVGHQESEGGMHVIDVSDPAAPLAVAACASDMPQQVQVAPPYAYLMTYGQGFDVVDISNPLAPCTIGQVVGPGGEWIYVLGDFIYLATQTRVRVYDLLDRSAPALVADVNWTPGRPYGVFVRDGYVYVADEQAGLTILKLHIVGDLNCDGLIDFADINPYVLALCNPAEYSVSYPNCHALNADVNRDGLVDLADVNPFVQLLTQRMVAAAGHP